MAAPFDDQAVIDLPEALTYTNLAGSGTSWAVTTLDDQGESTVFSGTLSLISRDVLVTVSRTTTTRPAPGATLTDTEGTVYTIVSSLYRKLGYFWEILARSFNVPGGLTDTGSLARRNSSASSTEGLNDPTWADYATNGACRVILDEQAVDTSSETAVDTLLAGRAVFAGRIEMRAGDRFTDSNSAAWNVDSVEPYDPSFAATVFKISRRI